MRPIDADEAYKVLTGYYHQRTEIQHKALKEAIERTPTIEAEPIRHGHWMSYEFATDYRWRKCSVCGTADEYINILGLEAIRRYCPFCGAKMDEEIEDDSI